MESIYPGAPGDTLVFDDHVVLWPDSGQAVVQNLGDPDWGISLAAEPGFVLFQTVGTAEPFNPHRIRNVGDKAVTHYIIELISERSPSEKRLPGQTNGRGTFVDRNSGAQQ